MKVGLPLAATGATSSSDMVSHSELNLLIRQALDLPKTYPLSSADLISNVLGWDSVAWINVIAVLEEALGREIPFEVLDEVETVGDVYDAVLSIGAVSQPRNPAGSNSEPD